MPRPSHSAALDALPADVARLFTETPIVERARRFATLADAVRTAAELASEGATAAPVRAAAYYITRGDRRADAFPLTIARWMRRHLLYRMEAPGIEVFSGPIATFRSGGGDCDDLSITFSALCRSVGLPALPVRMRLPGQGWSHMVGWCPPGPPIELSDGRAYTGQSHGLDATLAGAAYVAFDPEVRQFVQIHPVK